VARLDGEWEVERLGGALPPLPGMRKRIEGERGWTTVGPLPGLRFDVRGLELRYRSPFSAFVDVLEPDPAGFRGRATVFGREYGSFRLRRRG
jgi:hypothetical protein